MTNQTLHPRPTKRTKNVHVCIVLLATDEDDPYRSHLRYMRRDEAGTTIRDQVFALDKAAEHAVAVTLRKIVRRRKACAQRTPSERSRWTQ